MTYHPQRGRGYGHLTVKNFAVCYDAARRAGLSATAELLVVVTHTAIAMRGYSCLCVSLTACLSACVSVCLTQIDPSLQKTAISTDFA